MYLYIEQPFQDLRKELVFHHKMSKKVKCQLALNVNTPF